MNTDPFRDLDERNKAALGYNRKVVSQFGQAEGYKAAPNQCTVVELPLPVDMIYRRIYWLPAVFHVGKTGDWKCLGALRFWLNSRVVAELPAGLQLDTNVSSTGTKKCVVSFSGETSLATNDSISVLTSVNVQLPSELGQWGKPHIVQPIRLTIQADKVTWDVDTQVNVSGYSAFLAHISSNMPAL